MQTADHAVGAVQTADHAVGAVQTADHGVGAVRAAGASRRCEPPVRAAGVSNAPAASGCLGIRYMSGELRWWLSDSL